MYQLQYFTIIYHYLHLLKNYFQLMNLDHFSCNVDEFLITFKYFLKKINTL